VGDGVLGRKRGSELLYMAAGVMAAVLLALAAVAAFRSSTVAWGNQAISTTALRLLQVVGLASIWCRPVLVHVVFTK
jgi:hypothetical protein